MLCYEIIWQYVFSADVLSIMTRVFHYVGVFPSIVKGSSGSQVWHV